jgi:hypothetical protein
MRASLLGVFIGIVVLCFSVQCDAQSFIDIARLEYRISPDNSLVDTCHTRFNIQSFEANVLLPLKIDSSNYFLAGFAHSALYLDEVKFQSNVLQIGWQHTWNSKWKSTILLLPKTSSDGGTFTKKDAQIGGFLLISKERSPDFQWKFGAYVNGDRFGPLTVPILGFKWQATPSLQIDLAMPVAATVRKTFNDRLMAGIVYSGRKFSYYQDESDSYLEVGENFLWAFTDIYLSKSIVLNLRAGHSILRDYVSYRDKEKVAVSFGSFELDDNRTALTPSISQGFSFQGSLIWRVNLQK